MGEVINLFSALRTRVGSEEAASDLEEPTLGAKQINFDEITLKNAVNSERIKKERLEANKNVLKNYRIK